MRKFLFNFIVFFVVGNSFGQKPQKFTMGKPEIVGISSDRLKQVDNFIEQKIAEKIIPGAVVFMARKGQIIMHKAYGMNDIEANVPQKPSDIFRIMSMTKAMTSVAVMSLYEKGLFYLDEPISKYIPAFKNAQIVDQINIKDSTWTTKAAKKEITIRHLLNHTAGIPYEFIPHQKAKIPFFFNAKNENIGQWVTALATLPKAHEPGEKFTYGLNTDILGYFVEVISGMTLEQYMKQTIWEPLGMIDTGFYLTEAQGKRLTKVYEQVGTSHVINPKPKSDWTDYPLSPYKKYFSGGAGLCSTAEDYAKLCQMLLNQGQFNGKRILSRKTIEMMTTNQIGDLELWERKNKFGLGFEIYTEKSFGKLPGSVGAFEWSGMYHTHYHIDPKEQTIQVIMFQVYPAKSWGIEKQIQQLLAQAIID